MEVEDIQNFLKRIEHLPGGHVALVGAQGPGLHAVHLPGPELPAPQLAPGLPQGGGEAPHAAALVADGIAHMAGWLRAVLGITARNSEFINTTTAPILTDRQHIEPCEMKITCNIISERMLPDNVMSDLRMTLGRGDAGLAQARHAVTLPLPLHVSGAAATRA